MFSLSNFAAYTIISHFMSGTYLILLIIKIVQSHAVHIVQHINNRLLSTTAKISWGFHVS